MASIFSLQQVFDGLTKHTLRCVDRHVLNSKFLEYTSNGLLVVFQLIRSDVKLGRTVGLFLQNLVDTSLERLKLVPEAESHKVKFEDFKLTIADLDMSSSAIGI